jgi:hypothetical protein
VYVVARDRAVVRPVKVLFDDSRDMAVAGELQAGEDVIVEGQLRVVPGGVVQIKPSRGMPHAAGQPG